MPTDKERREVAQRIRAYLKTYQSPTWRDLFWIVFGDREKYSKHRLYIVLDRIADLIEPKPERTCIPEYHGTRPTEFACSVCGETTLPTLYWVDVDGGRTVKKHDAKYCSNCGSKVVE